MSARPWHREATLIAVLAAMLLAACGREPVQTDTVESLAQNPERLKEVIEKCRFDRASVGEKTCIAAREAVNKRFMSDGKTKYTPGGTGVAPPK